MKTLDDTAVISDSDWELLRKVKSVIRELLPDADVLLYGSVARGEQKPDSDYDLLILTDGLPAPEREERVEDALYRFELAQDVVLSAIFFAKAHWSGHPQMPFHVSVERDGVQL